MSVPSPTLPLPPPATATALPFAGDDVALIAGVRAGNKAAIAAFYDRYEALVMRTLTRVLGSEQELADLHHDVLLRALTQGVDHLHRRVHGVHRHPASLPAAMAPLPAVVRAAGGGGGRVEQRGLRGAARGVHAARGAARGRANSRVSSSCQTTSKRDAENAVYCSCRCGPADGAPPEEDAEYCTCPDGFECKQMIPYLGLGHPEDTGKFCVKVGTSPQNTGICGIVNGYADPTQCRGIPAP